MEQVNQLLSDPESVQKIMAIASTLGSSEPNEVDETQTVEHTPSLQRTDKQQALVQALLPYLHPKHQQKLKRAIGIAKISKTAENLIRSGVILKEKEESDDL